MQGECEKEKTRMIKKNFKGAESMKGLRLSITLIPFRNNWTINFFRLFF